MAAIDIALGAKIDLIKSKSKPYDEARTYVSKVQDVVSTSEGLVVKALMPISEGHIVPLEIGSIYQMFFYMNDNVYESRGKIIARSKEMNLYLMDVLLERDVVKVQRREFYRLPCDMEMDVRELGFEEMLLFKANHKLPEINKDNSIQGQLIDISANGLKFKCKERFEKDSWVITELPILLSDTQKSLIAAGKVIESSRVENVNDLYITRVQFKEMDKITRELIVKFVFEEQRRIQQQRNMI